MIRRVRMARKRLMVARAKEEEAHYKWLVWGEEASEAEDWMYVRWMQARHTLRAIERRKDRIC